MLSHTHNALTAIVFEQFFSPQLWSLSGALISFQNTKSDTSELDFLKCQLDRPSLSTYFSSPLQLSPVQGQKICPRVSQESLFGALCALHTIHPIG